MTDSMIERVARAIYETKVNPPTKITAHRGEWPKPDKWEDLPPILRHEWVDCARAAIAAMREPTEAMKEASSRYCQECADSLDAWHAGIDAALKEPT